jgi:L-seryl-tRNA(Ser) seleniumtransferase
MDRRELLRYLSFTPFIGVVKAPEALAPATVKRDLFKELGVRTFINAAGTYTAMTGSLMQDVVVETIADASREFCMLDEVQDKVGEKIAALVHSEAAVVTSGAFSAMTLGLAGILTGMDPKKAEQLPHLEGTGMKSEVICQKAHEIVYNHAFLNTGCKVIYIETKEELEAAINERTALLHFLHIQSDKGKIQHEEWLAIGKQHGIPTSIDIAADVPPVSNLWKFNDMGFSFVALSGGKAIRGPQSAGLLMGKKDIVAAARLSMPPRGLTVGRGMKVNKEEVLGMYMALESFMNRDHEKEWKLWAAAIAHIEEAVRNLNGITTSVVVPVLGNVTPTLHMSWDINKVKLSGKDLQEKLRKGDPSIEVADVRDSSIVITAWMLKPGQEKIVAARLKEVLS